MGKSYSLKTKYSLTDHAIGTRGAWVAELSAIVSTCGSLSITSHGLGLEFVSENDRLAERLDKLLGALYKAGVTGARQSHQFGTTVYTSVIEPPTSLAILQDCAIMTAESELVEGIPPALIDSTDDKRAYLRGAFLGGGTLSFGESGYLLEFHFLREGVAEDFCYMLNDLELTARVIERHNRFVVYMKDVQDICDCMAHLGAGKAVLDIQVFRAGRIESGRATREVNCLTSNIGKTVDAAQRVINDIEWIKKTKGIDWLDEKHKVIAELRLQNPESTLGELAEMAGVTKSCVMHRLNKLCAIARSLRDGV